MANTPQHIIVHTAAAEGDYDISDVRRWHVMGNGYNDVGYHFFIRKNGEVQRGRAEHEVGAHCRDMGMNFKSIGVCFQGHHNRENWTDEQTSSFIQLYRYLWEKYEIHPDAVLGHRETGAPKDCPGTRIDMEWVRKMLAHSYVYELEPKPPHEIATR